MSFETTLKGLVDRTEGALAAVLMGMDGIPVSEIRREDPFFSLQDVLVEYGQILNESIKVAQAHDLGAIREVILVSERLRLVFRILNATYFVCLVMKEEGNLGRGRYLLRRDSDGLTAEL